MTGTWRDRAAFRPLVAIVLACLVGVATATSVVEVALATILDRADVGVYGRVASSEGFEDADGTIRTRVEIEVDRFLSGGDARGEGGATVRLTFLGGTLPDGRTAVVDGIPRFEPGERVVVFARDDDAAASPVVGIWQGLWRVGPDGLVDAAGRPLGLDDGRLARGGAERDVDAVVDALAEGAEVAPEATRTATPDGPAETGAADAATDTATGSAPATDAAADADAGSPTDDRPTDASGPDDAPGVDAATADATGNASSIEVRLDVPDDAALRAALETAAGAWRDAGAPLRAVVDADAEDRLRIGPADAFGGEALSLSRRAPGASGVEVLLRPGAAGLRTDVLARELGRLAGLPDGASPMRSGLLPATGRALPTSADASALVVARSGPPEDLNRDGRVDFYDLALLAEAYGRIGTRLGADLDGSGRVDDGDVRRLREAYEFTPPSREPPSGYAADDAAGG